MEYTFRYYLSLGFCCTGGEVYREDNFEVELTDEQVAQIKDLLKDDADKAPAFKQISKHLPEIDDCIMQELYGIAFDYVTVDGYENGYYEVSDYDIMEEDVESGDFDPTDYDSYDGSEDSCYNLWCKWQTDAFNKMSLQEQAEYVRERYQLELDNIEGVDIEYYLPEELFAGDKKFWK